MKKTIAILLVLSLVATAAFAEVTWGAWGRGGYVFAASDDSDATDGVMTTGALPNWGGNDTKGSCIGIYVGGSSDNVGFDLAMAGNGTGIDNDGVASIWVKPVEMLQVTVGQIHGDELRGKIGASDGQLSDFTGEEDAIFARFKPQHGVLFGLTPAEGFYVGAALDSDSTDVDGVTTTDASFEDIQIGAGYTIADVGHLRAQYIGAPKDMGAKYLQVAFAYTAMEGLVADFGLTAQINSDVKEQTSVVLGVSYTKDLIASTTRVRGLFGKSETVVEGITVEDKETKIAIWEDFAYTVAAPVVIGAEVQYAMVKDANQFEMFPYAKMAFDAGYIKGGLTYKMNMAKDAEVNSWSIPLILQYSF